MSMLDFPSPSLRSETDPEADAFLAILIVVHSEAGRLCLLAGLNCCIANALVSGLKTVDWRGLLKFYPRLSSSLLIATQRLSRYWPEKEVTQSLTAFMTQLKNSCAATIAYAGSKGDGALTQDLASNYRAACTAGLGLLVALDQHLSTRALTGSLSRELLLRDLLDKAVKGEWPGLDADKGLSYPAWAERRRQPRIDLYAPAQIVGPTTVEVIVKNISLDGLGLIVPRETRLKPNEQIALRIGEAPKIPATVVWSSHGLAAVRFAAPLTNNDPRLKFCLAADSVSSVVKARSRADLFEVQD